MSVCWVQASAEVGPLFDSLYASLRQRSLFRLSEILQFSTNLREETHPETEVSYIVKVFTYDIRILWSHNECRIPSSRNYILPPWITDLIISRNLSRILPWNIRSQEAEAVLSYFSECPPCPSRSQ